jgi:hypothetical protein
MELLAPFAFKDSTAFTWQASKGDLVNGASIPELVWSKIVGTPFIGDYRRASVVHDVACKKHIRSSKQAHHMFYEAMLEDGTDPRRALLFYMAVRVFGPKWKAGQAFQSFNFEVATEPTFDLIEAALDQALGEHA